MKVRKEKDGSTQCVLTPAEVNKLRAAYPIIDQLVFHHRGDTDPSSIGERGPGTLVFLDAILEDKSLCGEVKGGDSNVA